MDTYRGIVPRTLSAGLLRFPSFSDKKVDVVVTVGQQCSIVVHIDWCTGICRKTEDWERLVLFPELFQPVPENGDIWVSCRDQFVKNSFYLYCVQDNDALKFISSESDPCVELVVQEQITSTRISLQVTCRPGPCPGYWRWIKVSCWLKGTRIREQVLHKGNVTFTGLQPFTEYDITMDGEDHQTGIITTLKGTTITTHETIPDKPEIIKYPSMTESTITWRRLPDNKGRITGYQLNIIARRDCNSSFYAEESHWFDRNVTEYKIQLKYGTKYTVKLRGYTSAGAGEGVTWVGETPVAAPEIIKFPSIKENRIMWKKSNSWECITGYKMTIFVWKDNKLIEDHSLMSMSNVTKYKVQLKAGANYMVTIRGVTASGVGEAAVWTSGIEVNYSTNKGLPEMPLSCNMYNNVNIVVKMLILVLVPIVLVYVTLREKWRKKDQGGEIHGLEVGI
ncbi:uncharacterized protein O3C94_004295 [Discoglossus pictus]